MNLSILIKKQKKGLFLFFISITITTATIVHAQNAHPHILVKHDDKQLILEKIDKQQWAKQVFNKMMGSVSTYVERHQTNPEWILSRYLMNRVPGKRYTKFYSDEDGTALTGYGGDAPFPTVRVSPHKRPPITQDGYNYKMPSLEELVPYDTSMKMLLMSNAPGGKKEWANPQTFVEGINGKINELALNASIIYWLTGKEEYARFAADILSQWARGASFQNPIEGPCRTGFLSIQTLGDGHYEPMPLIYDFLYNFLREKNYETSWYEGVFEKIASTMTFRGFWNNNWFAAQTPAMVFAALSLENKDRTNYFLNFYLNKDSINGSCGHLSLPSVVSKWLTHDGHWREPGGYHNFPVSSLLISAIAMENNGFNVFGKFPSLLQASYVLLKYSFPNLLAPSIGDTGPASQSPECLEIGLLMAKKYGNPIADQIAAAMSVMIKDKGYKRESSDYLGLLCYLPQIPEKTNAYQWPRSGELDFARCYLQRNGSDKENGLMYLVQGATYNHNHANGMSLELYGAGLVMGVDPGKGITYEAPMHVNYYAQWAAHNTVVAGGRSSSLPFFKGGGGTKRMGEIKLAAMEPLPGKEAISAFCSFTDTRYTDISTNTKQQRTLALIRTSPTSGYYVDIYRSDHKKSNEYVYHNIGNELQIFDKGRKAFDLKSTVFPMSTEPLDPPGFRLIQDYKTTGKTNENIVALFSLKENGDDKYMQLLCSAEQNREFYSGSAPKSGTADLPYRNIPTPTLISRQEGEAWNRPFIVLYEPFSGKDNYTVERIENADRSHTGDFTALKVFEKNGSQQIILQSVNKKLLYQKESWKFKGSFAVIEVKQNSPTYLYMGEGNLLSYMDYSLETNNINGCVNLIIAGNKLTISCNQQTTIKIRKPSVKKISLSHNGIRKNLSFNRTGTLISFTVPAVIDAEIQIN